MADTWELRVMPRRSSLYRKTPAFDQSLIDGYERRQQIARDLAFQVAMQEALTSLDCSETLKGCLGRMTQIEAINIANAPYMRLAAPVEPESGRPNPSSPWRRS